MNAYLRIVILALCLLVSGCFSEKQKPASYQGRSAKFLWTKESIESYAGDIYNYKRQPQTFPVPYSDAGLTWAINWRGKPAICYETDIGMGVPADPVMVWQAADKNFSMTLEAWIDSAYDPAASGILFWTDNGLQALGIRWKVRENLSEAVIEVFRYAAPGSSVIASLLINFKRADWYPITLSVNNNRLQVAIAGKTLQTVLAEKDYRGNKIGLYQERGIGIVSGIEITPAGTPLPWNTVMRDWNQNLFLAAANRLIKYSAVPEENRDHPLTLRRLRFQRTWKDVVPVQAPSKIRTNYFCDPGAKLTAGYSILPAFFLSSATAEFVISLETKAEKKELYHQAVCPSQTLARNNCFHEVELDLSPYADQAIVLDFEVRRGGVDEPLIACWSNPIVTSSSFEPNKPNVLFIVLDTLRADKVGCYGHSRGTTPHLDEWAKSSTLFTNAQAQSPWTFPSHASMFTSLYPSEVNTDSRKASMVLGENYKTIAEIFRHQGYLTAAFTSDLSLNGASGISQGFDEYREARNFIAFNFEVTLEWFRSYVEGNKENPWFVFLHSYACHLPNDHEQYLDYRTLFRTETDWRHYQHDRYEGGVRYADVFVNDTLLYLKERNLLDSTLVVITSDHGEDLGDRGYPLYCHHGHSLHGELTHVPLLMRFPGVLPEGKRIDNQVRLIDLLPTILEITDIRPFDWMSGFTLMPVITGKETIDRFAYSEELRYGVEQKSLRDGRYAFLWVPDENDRRFSGYNGWDIPVPPRYRLYDTIRDPGERTNLADRFPDFVEDMKTRIEKLQSRFNKREYEYTDTGPGLSPEDIERMKHAGYINETKKVDE